MNVPLAVIGGSGAYHLLGNGSLGEETGCAALDTPFGKSAPIHRFRIPVPGRSAKGEDLEYLFLSRHGEKDYSVTAPFVNYRANIYALKECGVERVVAWSGPGIINTAFKPGEFVLPHDLLDETRRRETTFFKNRGIGFIRQSSPFCPRVRGALHEAVHRGGWPHHESAVYACTEGPRLESPAEIRKYRILGADLVGMTLAPETFLARELEICYAPVCYLTNYAEGVVAREFREGRLFEGMQSPEEQQKVEEAVARFPAILGLYFEEVRNMDRSCHCKDALLRYKNKGMIGPDWRTWIGDA